MTTGTEATMVRCRNGENSMILRDRRDSLLMGPNLEFDRRDTLVDCRISLLKTPIRRSQVNLEVTIQVSSRGSPPSPTPFFTSTFFTSDSLL